MTGPSRPGADAVRGTMAVTDVSPTDPAHHAAAGRDSALDLDDGQPATRMGEAR